MVEIKMDGQDLNSTYKLTKKGENSYSFENDEHNLFLIAFSPNDTILQENAYEFGINNDGNLPSRNDDKLRKTIFVAIEAFFESKNNVLIYQCETGDCKQSIRARLFQRWFNTYDHRNKYIRKSGMIVAEGVEHYAGIILRKDNPKVKEVLKLFEEFISFFNDKPE